MLTSGFEKVFLNFTNYLLINNNMEKISGIYKITYKNRYYIGSSNNIKNRWYHHRYTLKQKTHRSPILQSIYDKHGINVFTFELVEECPKDNLLKREQYWIDKLKPTLNSSKIAGKPPIKSKEQIKRQSDNLRKLLSKTVYQYTLDGQLIKEWLNAKEAAKFYNIHHSAINRCAQGKVKSSNKFQWSYTNKDNMAVYINPNKRPITIYDTKGNVVDVFNSIKESSIKLKIDRPLISNTIKRKGLLCGKYFVQYSEVEFILSDYKKEKQIALYNKNKHLVGLYFRNNLISEFKMKRNAITRFLNSKKDRTYLGYYLRYEDDLM